MATVRKRLSLGDGIAWRLFYGVICFGSDTICIVYRLLRLLFNKIWLVDLS